MGIGPELPPHLQKSHVSSAHQEYQYDSEDEDTGSGQERSIGPSLGPSRGPSIGPSIGPSRPPPPQEEPATSESFAPELPPELVEARRLARERARAGSSSPPPSKRILGPTLPLSFSTSSSSSYVQAATSSGYRPPYDSNSDDDAPMVGPMVPTNIDRDTLSKESKIREFEERAQRMRKKLEGNNGEEAALKDAKPARAEWMMVPPESKILGDDPLKVTARQFQKREHKPQDSSLWTETPADREKRLRGEVNEDERDPSRHKRSKHRGSDDEDAPVRRSAADIEREEQIRKYNAEQRSESLFEAHATKYVKSKAWQKGNDTEHDNPSARPFDREKDVLGGRRIDHRQRDELVKQALDLGSKFSRGKKSAFL